MSYYQRGHTLNLFIILLPEGKFYGDGASLGHYSGRCKTRQIEYVSKWSLARRTLLGIPQKARKSKSVMKLDLAARISRPVGKKRGEIGKLRKCQLHVTPMKDLQRGT